MGLNFVSEKREKSHGKRHVFANNVMMRVVVLVMDDGDDNDGGLFLIFC